MLQLSTSSARAGRRSRPTSVDVTVGQRIRLRRNLLGVSQEKLAEALGVTFHQIQKYEKGANRVSAGKLYDIALALQVPISFFFDAIDDLDGQHEALALIGTPGSLALLRAFTSIRDHTSRKQIIDICKTVANGSASR